MNKMSFREELANIMAESINLVYTNEELESFKNIVKDECKYAASKGSDNCLISNERFHAVRGDRWITPREHPQIMTMIKSLELDVRYIGGIANTYEICGW